MKAMGLRLWALGAVMAPCVVQPARAQTPPAAAASAPQRIEIQGQAGNALQARRDSVAATVVVQRDELLKQGDTRLADALRRVPGLTVAGSAGRGAEVRLSGLGGGYTQLLLNGEPVPPGFSLESLSPEQVERVEVSRAASVEQSQQAIAGSVNIVLRRAARQAPRELKLGAGSHLGYPQASADLNLGDREGDLAWGLGVGLASEKTRWPLRLNQRTVDATGQLLQAYRTDKQEGGSDDSLTLSPRATWTLSPQQTLNTDHLLRIGQDPGYSRDTRLSDAGAPPVYTRDLLQLDPRRVQWRSRLGWTLTEDDQTAWELKAGLTWLRRRVAASFEGHDAGDALIREQRVSSVARDGGATLSARWRRPWGESQALAAGVDAEQTLRREDRVQRDTPLPGGIPVENLDEAYDARVRRLALFVQDEWVLSPQWSTTLGLRWEGLQTHSEGNVFDTVDSRVSVFSPVLQARWQWPDRPDQLRLGLSRSYKPPAPRDLMPRRYVTADNSPTTPNWQGNPGLRPELAWGLDAGWELPLGKGSQVGVNAYLKRIEDVIFDQLLVQSGAWVLRRANQGVARAWGATLDTQLAWRELWPEAPDLDARASLGWNRSRVLAVPGPDNRLAQQNPLSLTLGLDHRLAGLPVSWGTSFAYQADGPTRLAANRWVDKSAGRQLDLYATWRPRPGTQWRLSLSNLLDTDEVQRRRVLDAGTSYLYDERLHNGRTLRLGLEQTL